MIRRSSIIFFFLVLTACTNSADHKAIEKKDTDGQTYTDPDSADDADVNSCYADFFKGLPGFKDSTSAYLLLQDGRKVTLTWFFKDEYMSPESQYGLKDLDGDGATELVIHNNTGGAHCCDEFYIFHHDGNNFLFKAHLLGGRTCADAASNTFTYSLSETMGYFFSCYACAFKSRSSEFIPMHNIELKYADGKLQLLRYDAIREKHNYANLGILQTNGYEKMDGLMDNGWRKEFAINLAIWHYNHGKNWKATRNLFKKFYTFKDAATVWKAFYNTMIDASKESTF